jgi:hypothetical protein
MNVIVKIQGREAIPVRAIPLLTNWQTMTPDVVALALAWHESQYRFHGLCAFRNESAEVKPIAATWWESYPCKALDALHAELMRKEEVEDMTKAQGSQEWRLGALGLLPAGVFVWKDEFEPLHIRRYSPKMSTLMTDATLDGAMPEDEHARRVVLDFDPYLSDAVLRNIVTHGSLISSPYS